MRNGLDGLGLDTVVRSDDEHGHVGHLRAARPHRGERFMTRRVEEGDLPPVVLDLVRADVLGDAPGFARRDVRRADGVEQARLAVVDVAEDSDDGGTLLELRGVDVLP